MLKKQPGKDETATSSVDLSPTAANVNVGAFCRSCLNRRVLRLRDHLLFVSYFRFGNITLSKRSANRNSLKKKLPVAVHLEFADSLCNDNEM